jgi:hypothetical protein
VSVRYGNVVGATGPSYPRGTRTSYDTVAVDYTELVRTELAAEPLDRAVFAVLVVFAELVLATAVGPATRLGCGPRQVTAWSTRTATLCRPTAPGLRPTASPRC